MAAKPGAYYQSNHGSYRYFDGTAWVGERYKTKSETLAAYETFKAQQEAAKAAEEAEIKKKSQKPKKVHFKTAPKVWVWLVVVSLLLVTSFTAFWAIDNNNRQQSAGNIDPNGSSWTDSTVKSK